MAGFASLADELGAPAGGGFAGLADELGPAAPAPRAAKIARAAAALRAPVVPAAAVQPQLVQQSGIPQSVHDLPSIAAARAPTPAAAPESMWDKVRGVGEAAVNTAVGIPASLIGTGYGVYKSVTGGRYGTAQGADEGEQAGAELTGRIQDWVRGAPMSATGQRYSGVVGDALNDSGLAGVMPLHQFSAGLQGAGAVTRQARAAGSSTMQAARDAFAAKASQGARIDPTMTPPPSAAPVAGVPSAAAPVVTPVGAAAPVAPVAPVVKPRYQMVNGKPQLMGAAAPAAGMPEAAVMQESAPAPVVPAAAPAGNAAPGAAPAAAPAEPTTPVPPGAAGPINAATGIPDPIEPSAAARQALLARVMPGATVRQSVIDGNPVQMAGDVETARAAKVGDPGAALLDGSIKGERAGLQQFASDTVDQAGGTKGTDQASLIASGKNIAAPIDALGDWFKQKISGLYSAADAKAGGAATTTLDGLGQMVNTKSNFSGKGANAALGNGIRDYLGEQGIMNPDGSMNPVSVRQAEGVRQYINGQHDWETAGLSGKIISALDDDVTKGAGEDIYGPARALFRQKKQTLDNPNGISRMFDTDPGEPLNRKTAFEDLPNRLLGLDAGQLGHVTKTLRELPAELQPQGAQALAEIQTHMAKRIEDAGNSFKGGWNQKGVSKFMADNSAALQDVFADKPAMLQRFADLHEAGRITTLEDRSYGGADVQKRTLLSRGLETAGDTARQFGPAAAAATVSGPAALLTVPAAQWLGNKWAAKAQTSRSLKDAQGRVTRLADVEP